jgi:hypothetical protein
VRASSLLAAVAVVGAGVSGAGATSATSEPPIGAITFQTAVSSALSPQAHGRSVVKPSGLRQRVFRSTRAIDQLSSDGVRVAMLYSGGGPGPCIEIWNVSTGAVDGFPGTAQTCPGVDADDRPIAITEIALAGQRVLWAEWVHNATTYWDVLTATLTRRAPEGVYSFSSGDSSHVRGLRGDGDLLVFASYDPEVKPQARLHGAHSRRATQLRAFPRGVRIVGVHAPTIVVGARKGMLEVLNAGGKLLRTLDVRVAEVSRVALDGASLVVQRGRSVDVYDVETGRLVNTWAMAKGVLEDAHRGIAVYVTDTAVHLIRLRDGRDVVLSTPTKAFGEGPLHAQIEAAGLFYSYVNYKSARPGHVAFVPYRQLVRRFG